MLIAFLKEDVEFGCCSQTFRSGKSVSELDKIFELIDLVGG
jgi:hypothetical protein